MKRHEKARVLQRFFQQWGSPAPSEESAFDRVLQRLEEEPVTVERRVVRSTSRLRWPVFSLALVAVVVAVIVPAKVLRSAPAILEDSTGSRAIHFGDMVRGGTLKFADGSQVEVRPESEVSVESTNDGLRVRLQKGDVVVNAAKQLVIQTNDMSAAGKVFVVNTKEEGSRVAPFGGETKVQQGTTETTLRPGDQTASNPMMQPQLLSQQIAWS